MSVSEETLRTHLSQQKAELQETAGLLLAGDVFVQELLQYNDLNEAKNVVMMLYFLRWIGVSIENIHLVCGVFT